MSSLPFDLLGERGILYTTVLDQLHSSGMSFARLHKGDDRVRPGHLKELDGAVNVGGKSEGIGWLERHDGLVGFARPL
ncbi:hypothetical protein DYH09_17510, partial [bacterium CPR1]|nr:hypothetical protein [bacterium CPR1]